MLKAAFLTAVAVLGTPTIPDVHRPPVRQQGMATMYGTFGPFHGTHTATGEKFRPKAEATCAHKTLPFGTIVMVEKVATGAVTYCRINDRGPYTVRTADGAIKPVTPAYEPKTGERWVRILDMSIKTDRQLGGCGLCEVRVRYWSTHRRVDRLVFVE